MPIHRDLDEDVAATFCEWGQAFAFGTEYESEWFGRDRKVVEGEGRIAIETNNPDPFTFQAVDRTGNARYQRDRHVFDGAGCGFGDRRADMGAAFARQHDARHACGVCGPQDRSDVSRIGHAIEDDDERQPFVGEGQEFNIFERLGMSDYSLMRFGASEVIDAVGGHHAQRGSGKLLYLFDEVALIKFVRNEHRIYAAFRGNEQLADCAATFDLFTIERKGASRLAIVAGNAAAPSISVVRNNGRINAVALGAARALIGAELRVARDACATRIRSCVS